MAAPGPMPENRINDRGNEHGQKQIDDKAHALRDRPGNNGHRRAAEHGLENKERREPGPILARIHEEMRGAKQPAIRKAKHQPKANAPKQQYRQPEVRHVLNRYIDAVLGPREAAFQTQKTRLHEQH